MATWAARYRRATSSTVLVDYVRVWGDWSAVYGETTSRRRRVSYRSSAKSIRIGEYQLEPVIERCDSYVKSMALTGITGSTRLRSGETTIDLSVDTIHISVMRTDVDADLQLTLVDFGGDGIDDQATNQRARLLPSGRPDLRLEEYPRISGST